MINRSIFTMISLVVLITLIMGFSKGKENMDPESEIKALIEKAYVHGAFNELNPEAMRLGFHPDFAIFSADGENISKYPIDTWAKSAAKRKADPNFNPEKNIWTHNFANIDVTGGSAAVKIELSHEGKHVYTDYLSLLKFESGWKIVAKVYHQHK